MAKLRVIRKKYGKASALYIEHIHRLYGLGKETALIQEITGLTSGRYIYPYVYFREEQGYSDVHISMILKKLRDSDLVECVKIGGTPFYKLNYKNQEIIDSGLEEPEFLGDQK